MAALRAPQNRLGPKSYPSDPTFLEIFSAAQSPDAGVIAGCCDAYLDADRALYQGTDLDGVVPDSPNLDELFTDYGLELDGEVASPATAPFVLNADDMECGFLFREDEPEPEPEFFPVRPQPFEVELLSILEDAVARALPTITAVAVYGAAPDLETRMSAELQVLTVPEAKKRRKKVPTPAAKQTPRWHRKRERNNHAAALNRANEKATKVASKQQHQRLLFRNSALRSEVQTLEAELACLQAARARGGAVAGTASALAFLDGLAEVEFDLLPPYLPEL